MNDLTKQIRRVNQLKRLVDFLKNERASMRAAGENTDEVDKILAYWDHELYTANQHCNALI